MPCWKGYERVPGTRAYTKGSCRKIKKSKSPRRRSSKKKSRAKRSPVRKSRKKKSRAKRSPVRRSRKKKSRSPRRYSYRIKSRTRRKSPKRRSKSKRRSPKRKSTRRRSRACVPGPKKKFAKVVNGKCIRFGDPNMTIKKNQPGRKRSFCARHRCSQKTDKATPGYQSCLKWNCKMR